jgi:hypothetical protein
MKSLVNNDVVLAMPEREKQRNSETKKLIPANAYWILDALMAGVCTTSYIEDDLPSRGSSVNLGHDERRQGGQGC